ncbi:MAG: hypothetical protein IKK33_16125 [Lachnospiraceae bacterium]|nr:hypothetical protein [Lachnospiraceae bacterium]
MIDKIEKGVQLGVEKRIEKGQKVYWYSYAIQKKENVYYVYECEIAEDNMAQELYEFENVYRYLSLEEVQNKFPNKYEISFKDIHALKGNKIFNVDFYV